MKKKSLQLAAIFCLSIISACTTGNGATATNAGKQTKPDALIAKPKLVVGIVVDQMRYDFLYRYWDKYGEGGFKKLVKQGYNFKNTHYSYVPTYTGPGHASVYTGSVPAINGIIGNNWYNRETNKSVYCTEDNSVRTVGSTSTAGQMSPENLLTTTITDELRLSNNMQSKVIGIALKDRGSILPAGHTANGAYWFDSQSGNWITSTYYMKNLPQWVQEFNDKKLPDQYLNQVWNTLLPIEQYTESTADDQPWENALPGEAKPVFPHNVPAIREKDDFELIRSIPAGNTLTKEFALAALKNEGLGKRDATDFLAVSFSTTDYVGHAFGPNSIEVEDVYLRLDKELEELLTTLEKELGTENVLVFLTADHGAAHVPTFLTSQKVPAGVAVSAIKDSVDHMLDKTYGPGNWVEKYMNQQVYLDRELMNAKKLDRIEVQSKVANYVMRFEGVARAMSAEAMQRTDWTSSIMAKVENGYNPQRSGDVIILLNPGWFEGWEGQEPKGTTHGSYSNYDTHVPLLWYGWQVKPGESTIKAEVTDIAPTIASWLNIQEPNGNVGSPLQEYMK